MWLTPSLPLPLLIASVPARQDFPTSKILYVPAVLALVMAGLAELASKVRSPYQLCLPWRTLTALLLCTSLIANNDTGTLYAWSFAAAMAVQKRENQRRTKWKQRERGDFLQSIPRKCRRGERGGEGGRDDVVGSCCDTQAMHQLPSSSHCNSIRPLRMSAQPSR